MGVAPFAWSQPVRASIACQTASLATASLSKTTYTNRPLRATSRHSGRDVTAPYSLRPTQFQTPARDRVQSPREAPASAFRAPSVT